MESAQCAVFGALALVMLSADCVVCQGQEASSQLLFRSCFVMSNEARSLRRVGDVTVAFPN